MRGPDIETRRWDTMSLCNRCVDGLGGLGATIVDALGTAMIMGIDKIALEAVNLFETTIRILGGLLSAYHLSGKNGSKKWPEQGVDVVLRDRSAHPALDGLSSMAEVSTLQLEFNFLSALTGDPKYAMELMKVLEHIKTLPKVNRLVPIYIK
ncbi:hypothetical protein CASFOL_031739 [Castilleja foliolosa]|uniref:mannosyl-oligosaccharide 1,2-alpha-mannosidase n=1 Tax=Castilleja foliolosa TaxID=1961234 RepID=A0ABD3C5K4_9LAMI